MRAAPGSHYDLLRRRSDGRAARPRNHTAAAVLTRQASVTSAATVGPCQWRALNFLCCMLALTPLLTLVPASVWHACARRSVSRDAGDCPWEWVAEQQDGVADSDSVIVEVLALICSATLPLQLTALFLHFSIIFWADVPEDLGAHDACFTSGRLAQLYTKAAHQLSHREQYTDAAEYTRSVRALPTRWHWLHFALLWAVVLKGTYMVLESPDVFAIIPHAIPRVGAVRQLWRCCGGDRTRQLGGTVVFRAVSHHHPGSAFSILAQRTAVCRQVQKGGTGGMFYAAQAARVHPVGLAGLWREHASAASSL